ncbi:Na/Pi symporter [Gemmatimonadota bacterium]
MPASESSPWRSILRAATFLAVLYLFFVSIDLMSSAFKMAGSGFANTLLETVSDPLAGLILGMLATSLVQSSSSTTSIVVGLVAAGTLDLRLAIPMIMGANIGTTVTNTIVSMGHVTRRGEFKRAFAAGTVHDFFNVLAVLVIFPLEQLFHPVEKIAVALSRAFEGIGGLSLVSPLKVIVEPFSDLISDLIPYPVPLVILALLALFFALSKMVKIMRSAVLDRVESLFDRVLFRNDLASFTLGTVLTATVQSSSATTSLVVPLVGTNVLTVRKIFPYTLGANLGTTITAILASFATGNTMAITVALAHLTFNIMGIAILYPVKAIPIWLATKAGEVAGRSGGKTILIVVGYLSLYLIPILYLLLT